MCGPLDGDPFGIGSLNADPSGTDSLDTEKQVRKRFGYKHVTAKKRQGIRKGY
jgi:hypothetical protein